MRRALPARLSKPSLARLLLLFALLAAASGAAALELEAGARASLSSLAPNPACLDLSAGLDHRAPGFRFRWKLEAEGSGLYAEPFHGMYFGDLAIDIAEAGLILESGLWRLSFGKLPGADVVDSPYSLFLSGRRDSLVSIDVAYEDDTLLFNEHWIGLNQLSEYGWPDRGAVLKTYGLKAGGFRFGFQDVSVTAASEASGNGYLDLADLLLPAPSFFVQYVASAPGRPWTGTANKNSIMGFFADWRGGGAYLYAQVLVDDFNANRFFKPEGEQNPDKLALSLGGRLPLREGSLGLYLAAATKYTFQSIGTSGSNPQYGYSRWPANAYPSGGGWRPIDVELNMVGYRKGENDLSALLAWEGRANPAWLPAPLGLSASLEFSLTGAQSPGNPWHELLYYSDWGSGTRFLDDPILRKRLAAEARALLPLADLGLDLEFAGRFGYEWNRMELVETGDEGPINGQPYFAPGGASGPFASASLGARYAIHP